MKVGSKKVMDLIQSPSQNSYVSEMVLKHMFLILCFMFSPSIVDIEECWIH